jgi:hypothetical protein
MAQRDRWFSMAAWLGAALPLAGCAQVKSAPDELGEEPHSIESGPDASSDDTPRGEGEQPAGDGDRSDAAAPAPEDGDGAPVPDPLPVEGEDLPLAVDDHFTASGFMGDAVVDTLAVVMTPSSTDADITCGGERSSGSARGACHHIAYETSSVAGAPGWAGVYWQAHVNDWGDQPGLSVDSGATSVSFFARGKLGGEIVTFGVGGIAAAGKPYHDDWSRERMVTLTTSWTAYTIDVSAVVYDDVLGGFRWSAASAQNPAGLDFYLDDIEWK